MPRPDGHLVFVQIWSEPGDDVRMEVGPGERSDPALQQIADSLRMALLGRGFVIGGGGRNFCKTLAGAAAMDIDSITNELCALLSEVLGFDGTQAVSYKFAQDSWLSAAHVISGMTRPLLFSLLRAWELSPREVPNLPATLQCDWGDLRFRVQLMSEKAPDAGRFWEIHCLTERLVSRDIAQALIARINRSAYLLKAYEVDPPHPGSSTVPVGFAVGLDLSGGVSLDHIRNRIREWLQDVSKLCMIDSNVKLTGPSKEAVAPRADGATVH